MNEQAYKLLNVLSEAFSILDRKVEKLQRELDRLKGEKTRNVDSEMAGNAKVLKTKYSHMSIIYPHGKGAMNEVAK